MHAPVLGATADVDALLVDLFVVLAAAKLGEEIMRRLGQPGIVGQILAGVVVGPSVLGLADPSEVLQAVAELGVVFLLFWVGLETRLSDLRSVGRAAAGAGVLGVVMPFAAGIALGVALGERSATSIFLGAALVATSVGITSAVLADLGVLDSVAARTILGAAVIDDILALLLLSVAEGSASGGIDLAKIGTTMGLTVAFLAVVAVGGGRLMRRRPRLLDAPAYEQPHLLTAVLLCIGLAALAASIGLAAIIGAFFAGMVLAEADDHHELHDEVLPLVGFFAPFFFALIGMQVVLDVFGDLSTLTLLAGVTVLAVVTKFAGAWLGARSLGREAATLVGVGMVPRGEVGIIVAGIGRTIGVIDNELFAVVVGMSVLTTLIAPPALRRLLPDRPSREKPGADAELVGA